MFDRNPREQEKKYLDKLFDAQVGDCLNNLEEYNLFLTAYAILSHRHPQKAEIWWEILLMHNEYKQLGQVGNSLIPIGKINGLLSYCLNMGLKAW